VLRRLAADLGPGHIGEVLRIFLANATAAVDLVRRSLDAGDTEAAAEVAHRLKSACAFVGASALAALCEAVETGPAPAGAGEALHRELRRARAELDLLVGHIALPR
jgi:HPt (histidine-containing phosphotransfer) domain-containing protein